MTVHPSSTTRFRLVVVGLVAFALYLPGFWWGAPHATAPDRVNAWGVDDETPLGPLTELHSIIQPRPDRNLGYPLGYAFLVSAAYAPYLTWLKLTGELGTVSVTFPHGLEDPVTALRTLTWIAHLVTVLLGVGMIMAVFDAARTMWDERTAILAAALTLTVAPMFYYARTGNVDVPMLFFVALGVALFARAIAHGLTVRRAIWLGIAAGTALGIKESALGAFLAMPVALGFLHWSPGSKWDRRADAFRAPLAGLMAAILALGLSSGLFVDPGRYFAHIDFLRGRVDAAATGLVIPLTYANTWSGNIAYAGKMTEHLAATLTWPGLLLGMVGVGWTLVRERRTTLLFLPAIFYLAFMFITARTAQLRYALPAGFVFGFFGARAVVLGWDTQKTWVRIATGAVATYALSVGLLQGFDLTYQMIRDSRFEAGAWLTERAPEGSQIAYFGANQKLPPLTATVEYTRAASYLGMFRRPRTDSAVMEEILTRWDSEKPAFILVIPDHTSRPQEPYDNTMPPELYDALLRGDRGYEQVAFFRTAPLFPWIRPIPLDYPVVNPPIRVFAPKN